MDYIQDYSSSSPSPPSSPSAVFPVSPEPSRFQNQDKEVEHYNDSNKDNITDLPDILFYNVYSENYANNQQNMSSLFMYIPWRPSSPNLKQLKLLTNVVKDRMALSHPDLFSKFNWSTYGEPSLSTNKAYGRFSVSNLNNFRDHHITLCPNIMGPPYKIDQFIENLQRGISQISIPASMIGIDDVQSNHKDTLRRLLFKNNDAVETNDGASSSDNASLKNYVQLQPVAYLKPYASFTSQSMFLALKIDVHPESPAAQFFYQIRSIIASQQEALDLTWYTSKKKDSENLKTGSKEPNLVEKYNEYHITLMVGEFKNFNQHFNVPYHMKQLHNFCKSLDLSSFLADLKFNIDSIGVDTVGHNRVKREFKLKLPKTKKNDKAQLQMKYDESLSEKSNRIISRSIKSKKKNNRQHHDEKTISTSTKGKILKNGPR